MLLYRKEQSHYNERAHTELNVRYAISKTEFKQHLKWNEKIELRPILH